MREEEVTIIYGAGRRGQHAIDEWKRRGVAGQLAAFCDSDPRKTGTEHCGLPVLSREQVKERYGGQFNVWISPAHPICDEILLDLVQSGFVTRDRVLNVDTCEKYVSCLSLRSIAILSEFKIHACCILGEDLRNEAPCVTFKGTPEDAIDSFIKRREELIDALRRGVPNSCDGCPELMNNDWNYDGKIHVLAISPDAPCQMGCIYCGSPNARNATPPEVREAVKKFDTVKIINYLEEHDLLDLWEPIQWSGGEITINPKKREILTCLEKYPAQIFSNCVLYDEQVSRLIAREGSFLNVSIDAGTAETYLCVKGKDVFDQVCGTIRHYKAEGAHMEIKYIILPENCSEADVRGFVDFCAEVMPERINIICNIRANHEHLPDGIVNAAVLMAELAKEHGISYRILPYFGDRNMKLIEERVRELGG